jgi:hypothetical protein
MKHVFVMELDDQADP